MARKIKQRKFKIPRDIELSEEIIMKLIANHADERARAEKMLDYFDGRTDILDKVYKKPNRPTNRVNHPIASYLCNMLVGFTFGKGIAYTSTDKDLEAIVTENFKFNDIQELDQALADIASTTGYAYEIQYTDENAIPRMALESTENMFVLFDNTLEENMIYAVRYWYEADLLSDSEDEILYVELYSKESVKYFTGDKNKIKFVDETMHQYGDVPVTVFPLNKGWFGAFEKVIRNIDQYDAVKSDLANVMESNASKAVLVISGMTLEDEEGDESLEADVINFSDPSSKAEYLLKNIDVSAVEAYMDRLMGDIHTFSQIPPLDQDGFVASASGESLKWKCLALEILASTFESRFRKAIMRRLELFCKIMSIKHNKDYNFNDIDVVFTRNTPVNNTEMASLVKSLYGIVSEETLLSLLPFITDVATELEKKANEASASSALEEYDFEDEISEDDVDGEEI